MPVGIVEGNEIDADIFTQDVQYFCDSLSQVRVLGELNHAIEKQRVKPDAEYPELGQVISGQADARRNSDEITVCDLTGTGIQDTAIATLAYQLCQRNKAGTNFVS